MELSDFMPWLSPILVLAGWQIVYFRQKAIATRSETKSIIDSLVKGVIDISEQAVDFWINSKDSKAHTKFYFAVAVKETQLQHYILVLEQRGLIIDVNLLSEVTEKATLDSEFAMEMSKSERHIRAQTAIEYCMKGMQHVFQVFSLAYPPVNEYETYQYFQWVNNYEPTIPEIKNEVFKAANDNEDIIQLESDKTQNINSLGSKAS